jgi:sortase (surface protein transpeptidase)
VASALTFLLLENKTNKEKTTNKQTPKQNKPKQTKKPKPNQTKPKQNKQKTQTVFILEIWKIETKKNTGTSNSPWMGAMHTTSTFFQVF